MHWMRVRAGERSPAPGNACVCAHVHSRASEVCGRKGFYLTAAPHGEVVQCVGSIGSTVAVSNGVGGGAEAESDGRVVAEYAIGYPYHILPFYTIMTGGQRSGNETGCLFFFDAGPHLRFFFDVSMFFREYGTTSSPWLVSTGAP